jgi:HK97 family phage prohead protease
MTEQRRYVLGAELRAEKSGSEMKIVARAVKYGARSKPGVPAAGCYERCMPGCFTRSIASGDDVKALLNHDANFCLGRTENKTLRLMDSKDALRFEVRLNPDVQFHSDTWNLCKDGTLNACSFAFQCDQNGDEYTEDKDERGQKCVVRSIRSAKLYDVSIVANPAYGSGATSAEARSLAYEFKPESNEDMELALRVAHLGELVRADRDAMLADAANIMTAHRLDNEIRRDEKRSEFEELKRELGL